MRRRRESFGSTVAEMVRPMRSRLAVIALMAAAAGLASCKGEGGKSRAAEPGVPADAGAARAEPQAEAPPAVSAAPPPPPSEGAPGPAVPAFAVVYPGGRLTAPGAEAGQDEGLAFTTEASPDAVVDFYRDKAEAAGLVSMMSMNQGEVRAYGAADRDGAINLRVLAHPGEDGRTAVQLSWNDAP